MKNGIVIVRGVAIPTAFVDGVEYIALKPVVEGMGLDWASQYTKIKSDSRFNCCDITMVAEDGKTREMLSLEAEHLHGYLYTINPNKVRAELRERIIAYQQETTRAIHAYWTKQTALSLPGAGGFDALMREAKVWADAQPVHSGGVPDSVWRWRVLYLSRMLDLLKDLSEGDTAKFFAIIDDYKKEAAEEQRKRLELEEAFRRLRSGLQNVAGLLDEEPFRSMKR